MFKKLFAACLATGLVGTACADNSFSMAPVHVVVNLSRPHTVVFIVKNTGDNLIHVRIKPEFLPLGSKGYKLGKSLLTKQQEQATSLANDLIISPRALSLEPTEQREIRVSVHMPKDAKPGSYRAHIAAHMLEIAYKTTSHHETENGGIGIQMNMLLQIATALYGNVGHPTPKATLTQCKLNSKGKLELDFKNTTPWHMSVKVNGFDKGEQDPKTKPLFTAKGQIFRNSISYIQTNWKPKGQNDFKVQWINTDNTKQVGEATCHL